MTKPSSDSLRDVKYDEAFDQFCDRIADDFRELRRVRNEPLVIVAWVLPHGGGVYCAKCVQPTQEQRAKWTAVVGQSFVCLLCKENK